MNIDIKIHLFQFIHYIFDKNSYKKNVKKKILFYISKNAIVLAIKKNIIKMFIKFQIKS